MPQPLPPTPTFLANAEALALTFDPGDLDKLGLYLALLLEANKHFNLTAIENPEDCWQRHILDSLTLLPLLADLPDASTIIDVGSGGGVPGIPLAICLPNLSFTLLEPTGKKAEFLRQTAAELNLTNVAVLSDRAEKLGQDKARHREKYAAAFARAVGPLNMLVELLIPLVRPGGLVLAIKGAKADDELTAARHAIGLLGARHAQTIPTPTGRIVVLEKVSRTPNLYPRRDGEPKRNPLAADEQSPSTTRFTPPSPP